MDGWLIFASALGGIGIGLAWVFKRRGDAWRAQAHAAQRECDAAQAELRGARDNWEALAQNLRAGVVLLDARGRITYANAAARTLFRLETDTARTFTEIARGWQLEPLIAEILARRAETLSQTVVKNERAFQVTARAYVQGTLVLLEDMTELQRLGRVRRDFVANISHELRTPVAALQLLADTLARELDAAAPAQIWVAKLRHPIDVLHQLTSELMDLALIESGQMPIALIEISAADLCAPVLALLAPQAERQHITLAAHIPAELRALADPRGAQRVVSNLVHNAIKFTPARGRIEMRAHLAGEFVEFEIADTGIGISAMDLARIFERFYRADRARAQGETRSTGLGLAIAKHIVEAHGGAIWAESIEGKGSTFHFTLPRA